MIIIIIIIIIIMIMMMMIIVVVVVVVVVVVTQEGKKVLGVDIPVALIRKSTFLGSPMQDPLGST